MTTVPAGTPATLTVPSGQALTVVADARSSGRVWPFAERLGDTPGLHAVATGATVLIGPFATTTRYQVEALAGSLVYGVAPVDFPTVAEAVAAALAAAAGVHLSVVDPEGAIAAVVEIIGEGAPDASALAELDVNPAGDDNGLTFTAVAYGEAGNDISIAYVDPGTPLAALSVSVDGTAITVSLETDDSEPTPAILTTAAEVLAAIEAEPAADALVSVAIDASDTGEGDDGSGVVTEMETDLLEGGAGVGVGVAGPGSRYTDITNAKLYINGGTAAQPDWNIVTSA